MSGTVAGLTVGEIAAHHVIETAGGLGLPDEPVLDRRTTVIAARTGRASVVRRCAGLATLPLQLASAIHHIDWWRTSNPIRSE